MNKYKEISCECGARDLFDFKKMYIELIEDIGKIFKESEKREDRVEFNDIKILIEKYYA